MTVTRGGKGRETRGKVVDQLVDDPITQHDFTRNAVWSALCREIEKRDRELENVANLPITHPARVAHQEEIAALVLDAWDNLFEEDKLGTKQDAVPLIH